MTGVLGTSGGGAAGVTSVTAGNGITVTGTTTPTIAASLAAGTGIGISGTTTLSVSNTGVTSIVAGTNVSVSGATGAVTVNAPAFGTPVVVNGQTTALATGSLTTVARADHVHTLSNVGSVLGVATLTSQSSVTFSSIPQTYTVLYLFGAGIYGTITTTVTMTVNSVTSGYADTWVYWEHNGTTLSSGKLSSASGASQTVQSMFSTANQGMVFHVWFSNYATSGTITRYWNLRGQRYNVGSPDSVQERIGGGEVSAAPITSVTITASSGAFSAGRLILMGY